MSHIGILQMSSKHKVRRYVSFNWSSAGNLWLPDSCWLLAGLRLHSDLRPHHFLLLATLLHGSDEGSGRATTKAHAFPSHPSSPLRSIEVNCLYVFGSLREQDLFLQVTWSKASHFLLQPAVAVLLRLFHSLESEHMLSALAANFRSIHYFGTQCLLLCSQLARSIPIASSASLLFRQFNTMKISLSPKEAQLRQLLLDVARHIDESKEIKEKIELRFAGGWVRDRLLNIQSHDIDTAINAMTGYAFGMKMKDYLKDPENLKKHGLEVKDIGNLHKIAANPEKSKHLETITTKIFGFDVDFVNLRKETYTADSRNPQMEFGTAREDALRRDATVNALFYNLHTDKVEDFTTGLLDMKAKIIRTPLEPFQTFVDDPLRVLRLVRFASRLDFKIDPEAESCMGVPAILDALKLKISRERVGTEVEKMLKGMFPISVKVIRLLN
jgi:hypothetical protein